MLTLMTCNLRYETEEDGVNAFRHRMPLLVARILAESPDVIGFQEMTPAMRGRLADALGGYAFAGSGRNHDLSGESNVIAYRMRSLELHALYTKWLSDTPDVPGSRYEDQSSCPRIVTAARLFHPESGTLFGFYNTHLDHLSAYAQTTGFSYIRELIARDDLTLPLPRILTGDFNFTPDQKAAECLTAPGYPLTDVTSRLSGTFHGFGSVPPQKIDYVLMNAQAARGQVSARRVHECENGVYLSDHDPIAIRWTPAPGAADARE